MLEPELVYQCYTDVPGSFRRAILTEYLQFKTLGYIFNSTLSSGLVFMGGTAIRVFYGTGRFSEDLDFDSGVLTSDTLLEVSKLVTRGFQLEGVEIEAAVKRKGAFSAVFRFESILQQWNLTGHRDEVLKLKFDASPQNYTYAHQTRVLNRLDVTASVPVASDSLILAQKLHAILQRNRVMGRDLYDAACLFGRTTPDMNYLMEKQGTGSEKTIADMVLSRLRNCRMDDLEKDVAPFLPRLQEGMKVKLFPEIIADWAKASEQGT